MTTVACFFVVVSLAPRSTAQAQVSVESYGSVLVFPHIEVNDTYDTLIEVSNFSASLRHARCFYVSSDPQEEPVEFRITLTKQQPTHWVASRGRASNSGEAPDACSKHEAACDGVGFDPGEVPSLSSPFTGQLVCIAVDLNGTPVPSNHLAGGASLQNRQSGDLAHYSAFAIIGSEASNGDDILCLGELATEDCPPAAEYGGCPHTWYLSQTGEGASDPMVGGASSVSTEFTVVPCTLDLTQSVDTRTTLQISIVNEMEESFSASASVSNWGRFTLATIGGITQAVLGTLYSQTILRPISGSNGALLLARESRTTGGADSAQTSSFLAPQHSNETVVGGDRITLPAVEMP